MLKRRHINLKGDDEKYDIVGINGLPCLLMLAGLYHREATPVDSTSGTADREATLPLRTGRRKMPGELLYVLPSEFSCMWPPLQILQCIVHLHTCCVYIEIKSVETFNDRAVAAKISSIYFNTRAGRIIGGGGVLTLLPSCLSRSLPLITLECWLLMLLAYHGRSSPNITDGDAPNYKAEKGLGSDRVAFGANTKHV